MMTSTPEKAYILLADGSVLIGESLGAKGTTIGEIVFSTGMTGYQEMLTDPSYYGQILTQTYPLIGNYGINSLDGESERSWVKGYIVREWCEQPSNFRCETTVDAFLKEQGIVGIHGVDTRALTRKIRESGVMNGMITTGDVYANKDEYLKQIRAYTILDAVKQVSCTTQRKYESDTHAFRVVMMDFGYKGNILRCLRAHGCDVTVVPSDTSAADILAQGPDGIMLTNGPGDPAENTGIINNLKELVRSGVPIFGICLGHQLLALAQGAKTSKLKYGHRGGNQPVKDLNADRTYITSQNHGFAVVSDTLDPSVGTVSHINVNDDTCEGVVYKNTRAFTVQFHPEACAGPADTAYLFDRFIDMMKEAK
ncbi:MAG: carbamoyl phosphate synthase small subunit [Acetanaerobacterium sp.]